MPERLFRFHIQLMTTSRELADYVLDYLQLLGDVFDL